MSQVVELKTHEVLLVFPEGTVRHYFEDDFDPMEENLEEAVVCGLKRGLKELSMPSMIAISEGRWKPTSNLKEVRLVASTVTRVLSVEFDRTFELWEIISEE